MEVFLSYSVFSVVCVLAMSNRRQNSVEVQIDPMYVNSAIMVFVLPCKFSPDVILCG